MHKIHSRAKISTKSFFFYFLLLKLARSSHSWATLGKKSGGKRIKVKEPDRYQKSADVIYMLIFGFLKVIFVVRHTLLIFAWRLKKTPATSFVTACFNGKLFLAR